MINLRLKSLNNVIESTQLSQNRQRKLKGSIITEDKYLLIKRKQDNFGKLT